VFFPADHILVLGHRNPDTDASTSALGYSEFLNRSGIYPAPIVAGVLGELTPQSVFVFERAGVAPPPVIESLVPRVCDVATRKVHSLSVKDRFRDAVELLIRTDHSMLPVLAADGKLHSVFSHRRDTSRFLFGFDVVPLLGRLLDWQDMIELSGARPLGKKPEKLAIDGQLRIPLEGDVSWRQEIGRDDLIVCGDLRVPLALPQERFPRWVVLISQVDPDPEAVAKANERGAFLLTYRHSTLDFLETLTDQVQVGSLNLGTGACIGEFDYLHDVEEIVLSSRHALPVVNPAGVLTGVISRTDLAAPPHRRVILIDHFEAAQTVPGIEYAEILEIVDHHRVGDLQTPGPARVDCRPIGSSSSIVALRYFETDLAPEKSTAILLLGGLVADTLCLRSPTSTAVDRKVALRLAEIIGVDLEKFGREVLRAGDDLLTADPRKIWNRDQKVFSIRNHTFAVAQLETVELEELPQRCLDSFRGCLEEDFATAPHLISLLFLTNVLTGDSWVTACESPLLAGVVDSCFGVARPRPGWTLAKGVLSRKKQIIPPLIRALAEREL
jgi:manganese-dependent inorganic pyrophosphatase